MPPKAGGSTTEPKAAANLKSQHKSALIAVASSRAPKMPQVMRTTHLDEAIQAMNEMVRARLKTINGDGAWQQFPIQRLADLTDAGIEANSPVLRELRIAGDFLHELHAELNHNADFAEELDAFLQSEGSAQLFDFLENTCARLSAPHFDVQAFFAATTKALVAEQKVSQPKNQPKNDDN